MRNNGAENFSAVAMLFERGKKRMNPNSGRIESPEKLGKSKCNQSLGFWTNLVDREAHTPYSDNQPDGEIRIIESGG